MEQRHARALLDCFGHHVHGVAADDQKSRAAAHQELPDLHHARRRFLPFAGALQHVDLGKVERPQQQRRGMDATQPPLRFAIHHAVIDGGRFPAHPADHADGLHVFTLHQ